MPATTVQTKEGEGYTSRHDPLPVIHRKIDALGKKPTKTRTPAPKPKAKAAPKKAPAKKRSKQVERNGYKLFRSGQRYFFSKQSGAGKGWSRVYKIPDGFTVVRTPNGLPVLKRKGTTKKAPAKRTAAKKTPKKPAKRAAATKRAASTDKSLRPQCAAATPDGKQCRNSARDGSKYCGSHKGFHPSKSSAKAKDTRPKVTKAKDTAPSKRKTAAKTSSKNARCAAKTAAGKRCGRPSRDRSKYCASHKGYRP